MSRTAPSSFEERFQAAEDPWGFASSAYEQAKYDDTLAALGERDFVSGLELGCAIGVLTARLAERCAHLDALDASPTALARARDRTAGHGDVALHEAVLPEGLDAVPGGPWDLVVASEVLYYLDARLLRDLLARLEARMAPGGLLVAVHWTGSAPSHPQHADSVHAALRTRPALRPLRQDVRDGYRVDLLERV